jgi:hypothetical protein
MNTPAPKLLDLVRLALRRRHCSVRTERAYCDWIRRFSLYNGTRHPGAMGSAGVRALFPLRSMTGARSANFCRKAVEAAGRASS